ncbi:hypothetical protein T484DRAFT_1890565, partial [Baffinella frigidus]
MSLAWLALCIMLSLGGFSAGADGEETGALLATIESPLPGSVFAQGAGVVVRVRVKDTDGELGHGRVLSVRINGVDAARSGRGSLDVQVPQPWAPGIHTIEAAVLDASGTPLGPSASSHMLVTQRATPGLHKVECNGFHQASHAAPAAAEHAKHTPGFGAGKWERSRACLGSFIALYPSSSEGKWLLAQHEEAEGHWREAELLYKAADSDG